jgi:hypothetical protein
MGSIRRRNCVFCRFVFGCIGTVLFAGMGLAAIEDSRFAASSDGTVFEFELREVSRREVFDRLFANSDIRFDWKSPDLADERISGRYQGALPHVAQQLLTNLDFVLGYERLGGEPRMTRVTIVGRASGQASPNLALLEAALRSREQPRTGLPASQTSVGAPLPAPVKQPGPLQVPVAGSTPGGPVPVPIMSGLPSVAPIVGAELPVLPGPNQPSDVRK